MGQAAPAVAQAIHGPLVLSDIPCATNDTKAVDGADGGLRKHEGAKCEGTRLGIKCQSVREVFLCTRGITRDRPLTGNVSFQIINASEILRILTLEYRISSLLTSSPCYIVSRQTMGTVENRILYFGCSYPSVPTPL